jgi:5-methylcytosine-specific restriction endonuclease McrA
MRPCLHPLCPALVVRGRCPAHQRSHEQHRGNRHQRGYDREWVALRERFIDENYPWFCAIDGDTCQAKGRQMHRTEIEVDHIVKFAALDDPLRLDPTNIRLACSACHRARHAREPRGLGSDAAAPR